MKFDIWLFAESLSTKFTFHNNCTRITGIVHEEQYAFFIIPRLILLRMKNASYKRCRENQNTHFVLSKFLFLKSCRLCENVEKYCRLDRPQMTIQNMRIACWITKAMYTHTHTHTEYYLLFYCTDGCTNVPTCNVIPTLSVLLGLSFVSSVAMILITFAFGTNIWLFSHH